MSQQQARNNNTKPARRGVTLVEIAIVLVVIGLLLGGVLKGQELINNAKIRSIADQQQSMQIAWYAFISRYDAPAGDYIAAEQNIPGAIPPSNTHNPGDGIITELEAPIAMQNLAAAGFLRCPQCTGPAGGVAVLSANNTLQNAYGGLMAVFTDGCAAVVGGNTQCDAGTNYAAMGNNAPEPRLMSFSGYLIPSNIAAEVDRKLDDGIANNGNLVFNQWSGGNNAINAKMACMSTEAAKQTTPADMFQNSPMFWRHATAPVEQNCGFSIHI